MSRSKTLTTLLTSTAAAMPFAATFSPPAVGSTESFWNSPAGGDFHEPANWLGPVPDETVTAIFDLDADYIISFLDADAISDRLVVREGHVQLSLVELDDFGVVGPRTYDSLNPLFTTPSVVVGDNDPGDPHLTITGGTLGSQFAIIGFGPDTTGTVDFAPYEDVLPSLISQWHVHVGYQGQGALIISGQATVTCTDAVLGTTDTGIGDVTVSQQGSLLDSWGTLSVGKQGQGTLTVSASGDIVCNSAILGQQPDALGEATVTGAGSILTVNGPVDVGLEGEGSLHIDDGGAVISDGYVSIGTLPPFPGEEGGGTGELTVTGPASMLISYDNVYAGFQSAGTLNVLDGAAVICENGFVSTDSIQDPVGQALIQGSGSIWSMADMLYVRGSLNVSDGGVASAGSIQIEEEGQAEGDGTLFGPVVSAGSIRPGISVGTLTINGALTLEETSELLIELAGAEAGSYDSLAVTDAAGISGGLTATLTGGFAPQIGDRFAVLTADDLTGSFDPVSLPDLGLVKKWFLLQDNTSLELLATSIADLDADGSVGVTDFLKLLAWWGPCPDPPEPCPADFDGDGTVGPSDFLILLAAWG
jgi:T5SS/PEP-CTERM-associated repeat protein